MKPGQWTDREVEAHWDRVAGDYVRENEKVRQAHEQRFLEMIRHLQLSPGQRVLNVTSRDCEAGDYLNRNCGDLEVLHAEISGGLMKVAAKLRPEARQVKLETYSRLPFGDQSFDRIVSLETLEHVAEPDRFLHELYRVGKPGARMVLSCPPATSEFPYRIYSRIFGGHGEGPHRFPPSREVKRRLADAGWRLLLHRGTLLVPVGPRWIQSAGEWLIRKCQKTWIRELGIRQFYVCEK